MYKIIPAAYIFTHVYLNTMQQGIQSLHVAVELFVQNKDTSIDDPLGIMTEKVYEWAENHKTVRILSARGGDDFYKARLEAYRMAIKYALPWATFKEPDINDITTAFGFIMTPEMVFTVEAAQEALELMNDNIINMPEGHELAQFLSEFPSAR